MRTLQQLQDERAHQIKSAEDIFARCEKDDRLPTKEEQVEIAQYNTNADELKERADETRSVLAQKAKVQKNLADLETPESRKTLPEQPTTEPSPEVRLVHRYAKLKANWGATTIEAEENAYRAGMWIMGRCLGNQRALRWCDNHGIEGRALSVGVNTAGGNLVPDEFERAIINLREEYGVLRREARVLPMGSDHMFIPRRSGGITANFTAENVAITESDPTWNNVELTAKKLGAMTRMSSELAEDAVIDMADILADEFAQGLALKEDTVGFTGTGVQGDGGIVGIVSELDNNQATLAGSIAAALDEPEEVVMADLNSFMSVLPLFARQNAKFYCSQVVSEIVFGRLQSAAGGNTIGTLTGGIGRSFLGHEIIPVQVMRSGGGVDYSDVHFILFGDLSKALTMGERRGMTVAVSDQRFWDQDQIAMKVTERIDINAHDTGDATDAGPIVGLKGAA